MENTLTLAHTRIRILMYNKKKGIPSVSNSLGCNNVNEGTERRHSEQIKKTKCLKGFLSIYVGLSGVVVAVH